MDIMKRGQRLFLCLACALLVLANAMAATADDRHGSDGEVSLRVSIRKDSLRQVPSCQHSFSQVELLNLHATEPIMIHSIRTSSEETVLVESSGGESMEGRNQVWNDEVLPRQLHVSHLPQGSLSLGPGQAAIVPVTFLPRYPRHEVEYDNVSANANSYVNADGGSHGTDSTVSPPLLTPTTKADLVNLVGEDTLEKAHAHASSQRIAGINNRKTRRGNSQPRRSNMDASSITRSNHYEVSTTVIIETSRGVVKLPLKATSVRRNDYGIPDIIRFQSYSDDEGATTTTSSSNVVPTSAAAKGTNSNNNENANADTYDGCIITNEVDGGDSNDDDDDGSWKMRSTTNGNIDVNSIMASSSGVLLMDTLYARGTDLEGINHQFAKQLERDCYDLFLTNPSTAKGLEITELLLSRPELMTIEFDVNRFASKPDANMVSTGPSQSIRKWTQKGPMLLPVNSARKHIATLCAATQIVDTDESSKPYLNEMANWIDSGDPEKALGVLKIRTDSETLFISLERETDLNSTLLENVLSSSSSSSSGTLAPSVFAGSSNAMSPGQTLLRSDPEALDLHLVSSSKRNDSVIVGLYNVAPSPIRIMRVSVGMDVNTNPRAIELAQKIDFKLDLAVGTDALVLNDDSDVPEASPSAFVLPAKSYMEKALVVSCSVDWSLVSSLVTDYNVQFTGNLVLRGTMDTGLSYDAWRNELIQDPYRDSDLVLEISYSVALHNGRIEVIIEKSTHPYPQIRGTQGWDETGRAISMLFFPDHQIEVQTDPPQKYKGADEIVHGFQIISNMDTSLVVEGGIIYDDDWKQPSQDSLCNRFNISMAKYTREESKYPDFQHIGHVSLLYNFARGKNAPRKNNDTKQFEDEMLPTVCYLHVVTSPVDAGVHRIPLVIFPGRLDVQTPNKVIQPTTKKDVPASSTIGFDHTLSWFQNSMAGKSMKMALLKAYGIKDDVKLLSRYLKNICKQTLHVESMTLRPILLKAGAIEHGEIIRTPLHLTNHNPVPITISIDVGEVEGMSIALAREITNGRGDGNNMLDFVPRSDVLSKDPSLISRGKFQGHPVGGLRQFLQSNEMSLSLALRFPYRDAVFPNTGSLERLPLSRPLYQWYSYIQFHRNQLPERLRTGTSSHCNDTAHPANYKGYNATIHNGGIGITGPLIASGDRTLVKPLRTCWDKRDESSNRIDGTKVVIPPGGVARFDVQIRAPSENYLSNDIAQLVGTGLILSTNYGEVSPLIISFEGLQGQLHISHLVTKKSENATVDGSLAKPRQGEEEHFDVLDVPLRLSWGNPSAKKKQRTTSLTIPPHRPSSVELPSPDYAQNKSTTRDRSVTALFLQSTFARVIRLLEIQSCNPWFEVLLRDSSKPLQFESDAGYNVGALLSKVSCDIDGGNSREYPSYYQCALNWLSNRSSLQPRECGMLPKMQKKNAAGEEGSTDTAHSAEERAVKSLRRALAVMKKAYGSSESIDEDVGREIINPFRESKSRLRFRDSLAMKSGSQRRDGFLAPIVLDTFAEAWDAWRVASEYGLHAMSTSLRATFEYDSDTHDKSGSDENRLTLSMRNLAAQSVLEAPRLFDVARATSRSTFAAPPTGENPSVIEFPSTLVGTVVSINIPLKNPTSVPVRVRIATAPSSLKSGFVFEKRDDDFQIDDAIRKRYLQHKDAPYIQNGKGNMLQFEKAEHLWWDGGGAFFAADDRGDVIRSHQNITVKAGAGAHVALVNPSLHANLAFLVGCGVRCGIRENQKDNDSGNDPTHTSPIGASSAAGIALMGRKRSHLPQVNAMGFDETNVRAGGSPLPGGGGPAAFAIPFSTLDEIVIPPYGEAEIGPIFFRPPGRYGVLGCELAEESGAHHWGVGTAEACKSSNFESLLFLENSLTGLERVILRGTGMWERLYFLDPHPAPGEDDFGDIEFRHGRPTLVFTGTSELSTSSGWPPLSSRSTVVKEVVVHNGGDVIVDMEYVYLSDTSKIMDTGSETKSHAGFSCSYGTFRILNCWDSDQKLFELQGESVQNMKMGFVLKPGENRSLFIEHYPDCSRRQEYVTLSVQYRRENPSRGFVPILDRGILSLSNSGEVRSSKANEWRRSFRKRKIEMLVGYAMFESDYRNCIPIEMRSSRASFGLAHAIDRAHQSKNRTASGSPAGRNSFISRSSIERGTRRSAMSLLFACCSVVVILLVCGRAIMTRQVVLKNPATSRDRSKAANNAAVNHSEKKSAWAGAYRCLARADPSSTELQTLGQGQIRQVLLNTYNARGISSPQCFNSSGVFSRERASNAVNGSRHRSGEGRTSSGSERTRTLSDAVFHNVEVVSPSSLRSQLPTGLGWRTAYTKGIIGDGIVRSRHLKGRTRALMIQRHPHLAMLETKLPATNNGDDHLPQRANTNAIKARQSLTSTEPSNGLGEKPQPSVKNGDADSYPVVAVPEPEPVVGLTTIKSNNHGTMERQNVSASNKATQEITPREKGTAEKNSKQGGFATTAADKNRMDTSPSRGKEVPTPENSSSKANAVTGTTVTVDSLLQQFSRHDENTASNTSGKGRRQKEKNLSVDAHGSKVNGSVRPKKKKESTSASKSSKPRRAGSRNRKVSKVDAIDTATSASASSEIHPHQRNVSSSTIASDESSLAGSQTVAPSGFHVPLRPPPGLAPPPGFGGNSALSSSKESDFGPMLTAALSQSQLNLDMDLSSSVPMLPFSQVINGQNTPLLAAASLEQTVSPIHGDVADLPFPLSSSHQIQPQSPMINDGSGAPTVEPTRRPSAPDSEGTTPLLDDKGSGPDGFDVMDFLDSILNDANTGNNHQHVDTASVSGGTDVAAPLLSAIDVPPVTSPAVVSSNPWAFEGGSENNLGAARSRAAAYGISFDEDDASSEASSYNHTLRPETPTDELALGSSIPLLTTSAIVSSTQQSENEDSELATPFFSSLLEQDEDQSM